MDISKVINANKIECIRTMVFIEKQFLEKLIDEKYKEISF